MNIIQRTTPNQNTGRSGWIPDMIACHITDGAFDGAVSWLTDPASQASSHFVVAKDGKVVQLVPIENTAWANGTNNIQNDSRGNMYSKLAAVRDRMVNANLYTISIEHEGKSAETQGALTTAQLDATVELIAYIRKEVKRIYGKDIPISRNNIVAHSDIAPRWKPNCPGAQFPFDEIIKRLSTVDTPKTEPSSDAPSTWAKESWEWAKKNKLTDGTNPQGVPTREQMMQLLYNYEKYIKMG